MSTNDKADASTGSLAELFHLVGRLVPEGQQVVSAPPNMTVAEAIRIMSKNNFTQLPVLAGKAVLGVFSFRSLAQRLLRMRKVPEDVGELPVDEFVEQFQFVQPSDNWESILKYLDREDGVLVGHREQLEGIVTPMDVLGYLHRIASPFVMLAEIELSLRRIIKACVDEDGLGNCIVNSLAQKYGEEALPEKLEEMTFNDYVLMIGDGRNWPHFTTVFGEGEWQRKTTAQRLRQVGELRNEVFHFRREMVSQDFETLSARRDWLQMKARAFEAIKAEKAAPAHKKEAKAPGIKEPTRREWDEPSFFEALEERRGSEETTAARTLFEWANRQGLFFRWGTGQKTGSCIATYGEERGPTILALWTSGKVNIPLASITKLPPYEQEDRRRRLLDGLNAMQKVHIPAAGATTDKGVPLSVFADGANLQQFIDTMDWVIDEIEHASAGGPGEPTHEDSSLEDKYDYIANVRSREMARKLVTEICGWHPEHVSAVPTKHDISLRVSGRVFAVLTPRQSFFNVYTYDESGNWTRFRIDNEAHVKSVQPIVRANVEALLSGDGLSQDDERTLEARYSYIADPEIREMARRLVEELYGWDPERILVEPTTDYISIKVSGRLFAAVVPRMSYFNVYTYDATGNWTRHRVDNEGNVASVLPLVRANFEQCLGEHDSQMIAEEGKPEETAPPTEEEFWVSLLKKAPHKYDSVRRLIDCYQQRDDIELDAMKMGLLVRLDIRDTGRQATIFFVQRSGSLGVWPATIASQLRGAGVDPSPVERYDAAMRQILKMPKQRKEFYRSIADINLEEFKAAVDALIEEVQQANPSHS